MKTLGNTASVLLGRLSESGQEIFTLKDAQELLAANYNSVRKLMGDLVRRNWLKRLRRGRYLLVPLSVAKRQEYTVNELWIAARFVAPYYISWWTALHHYGYTEQVSRKVYLACRRQRPPVTLAGVTYQFVVLSKRKFFGFEDVWIEDKRVKMASREKMLIDCLDRPDLCGGIVEAAKGLWNARNDLHLAKLAAFALKAGNGAACKRLGYLLEFFQLGNDALRAKIKKGVRAGYSLLDPTLPAAGPHRSDWRLRENVRRQDLASWREH
jgi:predicted transcriptional regulator of viral defense system